MDGTVTKILREVHHYFSKHHDTEEEQKLYSRIGFAIDVNSEIDTLIDEGAKLIENKNKGIYNLEET